MAENSALVAAETDEERAVEEEEDAIVEVIAAIGDKEEAVATTATHISLQVLQAVVLLNSVRDLA